MNRSPGFMRPRHDLRRSCGRALLVLAFATPTLARQRAITLGEFAKVALFTPATMRSGFLSLAAPFACTQVGFTGRDFEPTLLTLIVASPSAFTINAAYQRRERALRSLASFRAASFSLTNSVGRWGQQEEGVRVRQELTTLYDGLCRVLTAKTAEDENDGLRVVYEQLEAIGRVTDAVRLKPKRGEVDADAVIALVTVLHADERSLAQSVEELRLISTTGTPYLLRGLTVGGAAAFPVLFAPYFASVAASPESIDAWAAYLVSFLYSVTISALVSIEEALEDPFDGDSKLDDITLAAFAPPGWGEVDV